MGQEEHIEHGAAWPFAITRSVKTGFRIVVAPDFLVDAEQHHLLSDAAGGTVSEDVVYRREFRDRGAVRLWLLYRVVYLRGGDVGLDDDFDRHTRRTPLIEGVVYRSGPGPEATDAFFTLLHELCLPTIRAFYLEDSSSFPLYRSLPIAAAGTGRTLRVEAQTPYLSERNVQAALRGRHPRSDGPFLPSQEEARVGPGATDGVGGGDRPTGDLADPVHGPQGGTAVAGDTGSAGRDETGGGAAERVDQQHSPRGEPNSGDGDEGYERWQRERRRLIGALAVVSTALVLALFLLGLLGLRW
ncbi:hypothetical protein ABZ348_07510 [Streptomyces sp. NPDC005963]|uniref:hypothetical protein n=1 Tax=Streptomyces sp. NPDC005963 TaxID=3156721 RepID=UPI0033CB55E2